MADRHSREQRSRNMSRIRKFGNASTELRLLRLLRAGGITGWRRHLDLPGRPDFTFPRERVVVFVDGCFWHRCPRCNWKPASNTAYWTAKLARNVAKDREADRQLQRTGWRVLRIWEHALREQPNRVMARIRRALAAAFLPARSPRKM
ncbi:MAG TPA: very short patch repair endonuclease [Gemmataceae bacterium]|nr:very short patch repair endonuclease [Gemmataceae bacterium]